jgi:hypothetical protein
MSFLNDYIKRGFHVFPVHGITADHNCTCGDPNCMTPDSRGKIKAGKHPWTPRGLLNASNDSDAVDFLFSPRNDANIGIVTGPISNIFVLDVDGTEGESSLSNYPPLPPTLTSTTGNGFHYFFRYPPRKVYTRAGKFAPGLDVRGEGGYVVAPPSLHATGVFYQFLDDNAPIADAPQWLLDIVCRPPIERTFTPLPANPNDKLSTDQMREMLSFIDADCGYDDWIHVGMALHNEGYGLSVWDEWSKRGSKYTAGCTIPHWKSFRPNAGITIGTVVHMASLSGWKPQIAPISLDDHPAREFILRVQRGEFSPTKPDIVIPISDSALFDPLKIPGLVGDTVREIVGCSQKPQPELALLNTLAALGAIFGRRYASPMDTRTNLYAVGIAVTAAGKDHSRRFIKRLMGDAKMDAFVGPDTFISGSGLLTSITKQPSQIMHLDEFGMLLEAITDQRGAHYMKAASKVITEMYSSSAMTYLGGQYADKKTDAVKIPSPNLCIYATTTPEKYISSLNRSTVTSGELNRFIVIRPSIDRPERRRFTGSARASDELTLRWSELHPVPILNNSNIVPEITLVPWPDLDDRIWDMGIYEDSQIANSPDNTGALWGRYRENVIKIAMILAIARNPTVPLIVAEDLDIGEAIIQQAVRYTITLALDHMADSQHEKDCQDILAAIKRIGKPTRTALYRATQRMNSKQRDDALKSLLEQDRIDIIKDDKVSAKPITIYRLK